MCRYVMQWINEVLAAYLLFLLLAIHISPPVPCFTGFISIDRIEHVRAHLKRKKRKFYTTKETRYLDETSNSKGLHKKIV